jgi:DNA polymerase-3 subunit epsilon
VLLAAGRQPRHSGIVGPGLYGESVLTEADFVVVDVETTGWLPSQAAITEIGAVKIIGGRPGGEFSALVNPGRAIPEDITALTGITDAMVGAARPVREVMPGFLGFARGCVLAAHNARFDVAFLAAACAACGLSWPRPPVLDTAMLARFVLPGEDVPDRKLATLAAYFGTRCQPCHRALPDARATAEILNALLKRLAHRSAGVTGPSPDGGWLAPAGTAAVAAAGRR